MMRPRPKPTQHFLQGIILGEIGKRVRRHARVLEAIRLALPTTLSLHCRACVVREDGKLLIYTDSSAFATKLRFYAPSILATLNAPRMGQDTCESYQFSQILIRQMERHGTMQPDKTMAVASDETIQMIKSSSQSTSCCELAESLARLSATMEKHRHGS